MSADQGDIEMIVAWCLGEADEAAAARVERGRASSPDFARLVESIAAMVQTLRRDDSFEPPLDVVRRAKALMEPARAGEAGRLAAGLAAAREGLLRLIFDSLGGASLAGFRGGALSGAGERHLLFGGDLGEIDLRIEALPDGARRMTGQIDTAADLSSVTVALERAGEGAPGLTPVVDAMGVFTMTAPPGRYVLSVGSAAGVARTPEFDA